MSNPGSDKNFGGSIPQIYEKHLVPLLFEPYAADIAAQLASRPVRRILEIAAGTGVVTRAMAAALPESVSIVATDLNQAMVDQAVAQGTPRPVTWQQADAMQLPFDNEAFDAVVCQFGVMFFPEKARAHAEVCRVLKPGGLYIFNVWDRLQANEIADTVEAAMEAFFPEDPPRFLARTPYGYHDIETIKSDLAAGGFTTSAEVTTRAFRSQAASNEHPAIAYCQGTPLRNEIVERDATRLQEATAFAAEAIAHKFGRDNIDAQIQAHVVTITK